MQQCGEMGACFRHRRRVLFSGECATSAAEAEECLGQGPREPSGGPEVEQERDAASLHSEPGILPPQEGSPFLLSSKRSATTGKSPTIGTKPCHLTVTSQGPKPVRRTYAPAVKDLSVEHLLCTRSFGELGMALSEGSCPSRYGGFYPSSWDPRTEPASSSST